MSMKLDKTKIRDFVPPLMPEIETVGDKQKAYCWNTEGIFRLIQSIPSPKAEPFTQNYLSISERNKLS